MGIYYELVKNRDINKRRVILNLKYRLKPLDFAENQFKETLIFVNFFEWENPFQRVSLSKGWFNLKCSLEAILQVSEDQ